MSIGPGNRSRALTPSTPENGGAVVLLVVRLSPSRHPSDDWYQPFERVSGVPEGLEQCLDALCKWVPPGDAQLGSLQSTLANPNRLVATAPERADPRQLPQRKDAVGMGDATRLFQPLNDLERQRLRLPHAPGQDVDLGHAALSHEDAEVLVMQAPNGRPGSPFGHLFGFIEEVEFNIDLDEVAQRPECPGVLFAELLLTLEMDFGHVRLGLSVAA